jgi:SAM-dependent methyltransferase
MRSKTVTPTPGADLADWTKQVDFGKTASDYARHRAGFPASFFQRLGDEGIARPGSRALDLGTGTGTVARGLAQMGLAVTGLDPADDLTAQARQLDGAAGVSIDYVTAKAEQTGLPDNHFDLVTAGQCWHWFERTRAAAEARRILKPGGTLLVAHFDWLPLPGNVVSASERLIRRHNPEWSYHGATGVYRHWHTDLRTAAFGKVQAFTYDEDATYTREAWCGRIRASAGIAASLAPAAVAIFDAEHRQMLEQEFPGDPLAIPHCIFAVYGSAP